MDEELLYGFGCLKLWTCKYTSEKGFKFGDWEILSGCTILNKLLSFLRSHK